MANPRTRSALVIYPALDYKSYYGVTGSFAHERGIIDGFSENGYAVVVCSIFSFNSRAKQLLRSHKNAIQLMSLFPFTPSSKLSKLAYFLAPVLFPILFIYAAYVVLRISPEVVYIRHLMLSGPFTLITHFLRRFRTFDVEYKIFLEYNGSTAFYFLDSVIYRKRIHFLVFYPISLVSELFDLLCADFILLLTDANLKYYSVRWEFLKDVFRKKARVVGLGVRADDVEFVDRYYPALFNSKDPRFIVSFVYSGMAHHGISGIIRAFLRFIDICPSAARNAILVIYGPIPREIEFYDLEDLRSKGIFFAGYVPHDALLRGIAHAALGIDFELGQFSGSTFDNVLYYPIKLLDYLVSGVPILTNGSGPAQKMLILATGGARFSDPSELSMLLCKYYTEWKKDPIEYKRKYFSLSRKHVPNILWHNLVQKHLLNQVQQPAATS